MAPAVAAPPPPKQKPTRLLTAEEFAAMPELGPHTELVKGVVIDVSSPGFRHGEICVNISFLLGQHVRPRHLGRLVSNDSGVVTRRSPDSVRGADVAYFSYERLPKHIVPAVYPDVSPEVVFEVMSPDDTWKEAAAKADEYVAAGVDLVYVVEAAREQAVLFRKGELGTVFSLNDELVFPGVLAELRIPLRSLFE